MPEHVIPFQPRRFAGAAAHYLQGRPPYAPTLIRRVAERVGLTPADAVVDLGCGPGQLASGFAYFAGRVLGMDPEPEMLTAAVARVEGVLANVTFVQGSSYDLGPAVAAQFGPFRLATIGRAFHWMDRAETLARLDTMIEPGGAVALFHDIHPDVPQNAWLAEYRALRTRTTGAERAAWRQPGWPTHDGLLLASPFARLERIGIIENRYIPPARLVDRALSMSRTSRARLGTQVDQLAADILALGERLAVNGLIEEVVESSALLAFRDRS